MTVISLLFCVDAAEVGLHLCIWGKLKDYFTEPCNAVSRSNVNRLKLYNRLTLVDIN